jgi:putative membrane protein
MMRSIPGARSARKTPLHPLLITALALFLCARGGPFGFGERGSLLVGVAAAQQVDRVVPPAAIAGEMAPVDEAFALFAASSALAQLEGARLVLDTTRDTAMIEFAQRIVREHTAALEKLRVITAPRGVVLPQAATGRHADLVTKLAGVARGERDAAFIHRFGLDAHKEAIGLTERQVKEGRDPELRRYAGELLETLREQMSAARKLAHAASAK